MYNIRQEPAVVAEWSKSPCFKFKQRQMLRSQVQIPARDYDIDLLRVRNKDKAWQLRWQSGRLKIKRSRFQSPPESNETLVQNIWHICFVYLQLMTMISVIQRSCQCQEGYEMKVKTKFIGLSRCKVTYTFFEFICTTLTVYGCNRQKLIVNVHIRTKQLSKQKNI